MQSRKSGEQKTAFVTGATGLLGNNLVRVLLAKGYRVKGLARSREKAAKQFPMLDVEIVEGDMTNVSVFEHALEGVDELYHTAAHFRDSYKGGNHEQKLTQINVVGTRSLLSAAYDRGIRRVIHTSSSAVLKGKPGRMTDETMSREEKDADDYYRSKIQSEKVVSEFLKNHPSMFGCFVLPGWMVGPGDMGPTSSGQMVLDFVKQKLPGILPLNFSIVDARDVALAEVSAMERGRSGERYLAAGRKMSAEEIYEVLERVSGIKAPTRHLSLWPLYVLGSFSELYSRITGRQVRLGLAATRLMASESEHAQFDPAKSEKELGVVFRPVEATFADEIDWYRENGWLPKTSRNKISATASASS